VAGAGVAGFMAKSEPRCDGSFTRTSGFVQRGTVFRNNWVHGTRTGEGFYIGRSFWNGLRNGTCPDTLPHAVAGLEVYGNLIEDTGAEGLQIGEGPENGPTEVSDNWIEDPVGHGITVRTSHDNRILNNVILRAGRGPGARADRRRRRRARGKLAFVDRCSGSTARWAQGHDRPMGQRARHF
jgi:hypothetical protein